MSTKATKVNNPMYITKAKKTIKDKPIKNKATHPHTYTKRLR